MQCNLKQTSGFQVQKQPPRCVLSKGYSENMQQIYRRTPIPKCNFNKVAFSNFIEITLQDGCSTANLLHVFRTSFSKNTSGWLVLQVQGNIMWLATETTIRRCSVKKIFLKISQNSQGNICTVVSF